MSDGCKIKKTGDAYSLGYNLNTSAIKIYCSEGDTATAPLPPINLVAVPNNASVDLTWSSAGDGGSAITDYQIEYGTSLGSFNVFSDGVSTSTSATVTGLTNGTAYLFRISSTNAIGTSSPSQMVYAIPRTVPDAPSISSTIRGDSSVTVSWDAPASNGGSNITEYILEYSGDSGSSWTSITYSSSITSATIGNLTNGISYIFRIAATNIAGTGSTSTNSASVTPATTPDAPSNVVLSFNSVDSGKLSISWSTPDDGGSSLTAYIIQYSANNGTSWSTAYQGALDESLNNFLTPTLGITYIARIAAINNIGTGPYTVSNIVVPGIAPGPAVDNFSAIPDNASAFLTWDIPYSTGGREIMYYIIQYSNDDGSTWSSSISHYPDNGTSRLITGLINTTESYIFRIRYYTELGFSSYATTSPAITPDLSIPCVSNDIDHDYVLVFIDEAHPLYVKGSGQVGSLWGADLEYYNNILSNFPTCATILFDVDTPFVARGIYKGQSISSDPFYIFPTGVNTSSYEQCVLPIDNITGIARPSGGIEYNGSANAIGSISANTFATGIVNAIETFWGSNFWSRMENSYNPIQNRPCKLWITRGHTISLGSGILSSGIEIFSNHVINNKNWTTDNIGIYINTCGERYLGWIPDVIQSQGNNDSCFNTTRVPDITQDNECGSNAGDRLVKFYFDAPDYPGYTYLNTCSGTDNLNDQFDGNIFFEGLSLRIHPLFSCTGVYNSSMVTTFNDPSNNRLLAQWNFYSSTFGMDQNPASRSVYPWVYEGKMYLSYENNVPYVTVGVAEWDDRVVEPSNSAPGTFYIWKSPIPLDVYGVPSGTVEESFVVASGRLNNLNWVVNSVEESNFLANLGFSTTVGSAIEAGTGIPQFPNISFVSSPSCSTTPLPGSICLSIP